MVTDVTGPVAASARRPAVSAGIPILAAKITAPAVPDWAVPRPRITKLIAASARRWPLTIVTGPPGAGKTMALALWAAAESGTVAWISLDDFDNQPGAFWSHTVAALGRSGVALPKVLSAALPRRQADHTFLVRLTSVLAAQDPPVTLIVDDLHVLTRPCNARNSSTCCVKEVLHKSKLGVAADERRLGQPLTLTATRSCHHSHRPPQPKWLTLPLCHVLARVREQDRRRSHLPRHPIHEHAPRLRRRLHPRRRIHPIPDDDPLTRILQRRHLTRHHSRPRPQSRRPHLHTKHADRIHDLKRRPHCPLRIILPRHRRTPHRHHRIPDELLNQPPIPLDDRPRHLEIPAQQLAHVLRGA